MELKHNVSLSLISVSRKNSCLTVSIVRRAVSSSHRSFSPFDSVDTVQQIAHYTARRRDSFAYIEECGTFSFLFFSLVFLRSTKFVEIQFKKGSLPARLSSLFFLLPYIFLIIRYFSSFLKKEKEKIFPTSSIIRARLVIWLTQRPVLVILFSCFPPFLFLSLSFSLSTFGLDIAGACTSSSSSCCLSMVGIVSTRIGRLFSGRRVNSTARITYYTAGRPYVWKEEGEKKRNEIK